MIAKISVWAPTRARAVERLRVALNETCVLAPSDSMGVKRGSLRTNLSFLRRLTSNADVIRGDTATDLIPKNPSLTADPSAEVPLSAVLATAIYQMLRENAAVSGAQAGDTGSNWTRIARREGVRA